MNHLLRVRRPSPALAISALALFFAVGGSAFAVGQRVAVAQPRCANGAVKAFAYVTGDPTVGIHNLAETLPVCGRFRIDINNQQRIIQFAARRIKRGDKRVLLRRSLHRQTW